MRHYIPLPELVIVLVLAVLILGPRTLRDVWRQRQGRFSRNQGIVRALLALVAFSLLALAWVFNARAAAWAAASIMVGAWLWTFWILRPQRDSH
jgi:hypothetical protein